MVYDLIFVTVYTAVLECSEIKTLFQQYQAMHECAARTVRIPRTCLPAVVETVMVATFLDPGHLCYTQVDLKHICKNYSYL